MKAIFGTFNIDMLPLETVDVSDKINNYLKGDILVIPKNISFRSLFGNVGGRGEKYLQITANGRMHNILEDGYVEDIEIDLANAVNNIKIVYYFFTSPNSNWRAILSGQLYQLKSYGITSEADLYVHVTDCNNFIAEIREIIAKIVPEAIVSVSTENLFEYPAIKLVHDLAVQSPENIYLYFHSKGMSHNIHSRLAREVILFTRTFENWRRNIQSLYKENKQKAGLFPSAAGFIWYNFWYAKGTYLAKCKAPEISESRYYYENWLGEAAPQRKIPVDDCISIFKIKNLPKQYFTATEANIYKDNLMEKHFSHAERKEFRVVRTPLMIYSQLKFDSFFKLFKKKRKK